MAVKSQPLATLDYKTAKGVIQHTLNEYCKVENKAGVKAISVILYRLKKLEILHYKAEAAFDSLEKVVLEYNDTETNEVTENYLESLKV